MTSSLPSSCVLCPRRCGADRASGERGVCGADDRLRVARAALHEWEEPGISVGAGSGAVFFGHCPLRCVYCQNRPIALGEAGLDIPVSRLAEIFVELRCVGAANINLVTPTHYLPQIREAQSMLSVSHPDFDLPFVCNTSGYERAEAVREYTDCFDVYLTDFKYWRDGESDAARRYSRAPDYFEVAVAALDAMVDVTGLLGWESFGGDLRLCSGVVVRHLLLPGRLEDSKRIMAFLWERYGERVLYSVMDQYTPMRVFPEAPELDVRTDPEDYERLLDFMDDLGMEDYFWQQGGASQESFIPPFDNTGVLKD